MFDWKRLQEDFKAGGQARPAKIQDKSYDLNSNCENYYFDVNDQISGVQINFS